jgi:hypothetical protein
MFTVVFFEIRDKLINNKDANKAKIWETALIKPP